MIWVTRSYDKPEPLILSVGEEAEVSIKDVAMHIARAMDLPLDRVKFDTSKSDGQFKKTADNSRLVALRPDFEFTPIEAGIATAAKWFEDNYETARK